MKFEIFKGKDEQYYFRIKASNGEPVAASEGYKQKQSAKDTIDSIKKNEATATVVDLT